MDVSSRLRALIADSIGLGEANRLGDGSKAISELSATPSAADPVTTIDSRRAGSSEETVGSPLAPGAPLAPESSPVFV